MAVNKTKDGIWYFKVDWKDSRGRQQQTKKQSVKWKKSDAQKAEREFILSLDKRNSIVLEMTYGELYDLYKTAKKRNSRNDLLILMMIGREVSSFQSSRMYLFPR